MIIAFTIALFVFFFWLAYKLEDDLNSYLLGVILVIALATIPVAVFTNSKVCDVPSKIVTPLYAGYNNSELHGDFFLGSGSVDDVDMVYYWVNNNGVKSKHSKKMSDSVFIEDGKNLMVETYESCPKNLNWLFIDVGKTGKTEFHVPENSIMQMYKYQ